MKQIDELKSIIRTPEFRERLFDIYQDESRVPLEEARYEDALDTFRSLFGDKAVEIYSAPGRTEIGGNHTDHQHGEVLAASINDDAIAVAAPRGDTVIRVQSAGYPMITLPLPEDPEELSPLPEEKGTTQGLIRGVAAGQIGRGRGSCRATWTSCVPARRARRRAGRRCGTGRRP